MLAAALPDILTRAARADGKGGVYHMTAGGSTAWCGFARAIVGERAKVAAIRSSEYPTPARRPRNSVLDNTKLEQSFGIRLPSWQAGLEQVLRDLAE
jgi:dTDP-4-dehydrorhamnose reductase